MANKTRRSGTFLHIMFPTRISLHKTIFTQPLTCTGTLHTSGFIGKKRFSSRCQCHLDTSRPSLFPGPSKAGRSDDDVDAVARATLIDPDDRFLCPPRAACVC